MNVTNYQQLHGGMKSFSSNPAFPLGSNTIDKSNARKSVVNKISSANAALEFHDLGYLQPGTTISFQVQVRATSVTTGNAAIEIESRTGVALSTGRKVVNIANTINTEWTTLRCDWIVVEGDNWISLAYGAATTTIGVFEFRNPRLRIENSADTSVLSCSLVRSSNVWAIDNTSFLNNGIYLVSASGDSIVIGWPYTANIRNPIVQVSVDTGFNLATAGFITAGPHTISQSGCSIRLVTTAGAFVSDVTTGGTVRLHVSVIK